MRDIATLFPDARAPDGQRGAYLLAITLDEPLAGNLRGSAYVLPAGTYLYAGSAKGAGGIAARVARHLRKDKTLHWHVDALTLAASRITALAFPGGSECALVERLLAAGCTPPIAGFGSSDCRSCTAHLLQFNKAGDNPLAAG